MTSPGNLNEMCQVLHDTLKCEICKSPLNVGKTRWYRCQKHHQICQNCTESRGREKCICMTTILQDHCPVTEKLLKVKIMGFSCTNENRGCKEILGEEDMTSHEVKCKYRIVECPLSSCKSRVPFHELLEHMTEKKCHTFRNFVINGKTLMTSRFDNLNLGHGFSKRPTKVEFDGKVFFRGARVSGSTYYHWIQLYGSKVEANNYYYTLEFHGRDENIKTIFSGQVFAIDETPNSIKESNKCFGIKFNTFKELFVDENREFNFSVTIRSMKGEGQDENSESGISDNDA